jgi:hypothetical protein
VQGRRTLYGDLKIARLLMTPTLENIQRESQKISMFIYMELSSEMMADKPKKKIICIVGTHCNNILSFNKKDIS